MFSFDFQRTATALIGALLFSTVCVGAAVAPAHQISDTIRA